jgi:hypothetical protein
MGNSQIKLRPFKNGSVSVTIRRLDCGVAQPAGCLVARFRRGTVNRSISRRLAPLLNRVHAYRDWRNRLILFDNVDVLTYAEVDLDGQQFPLAPFDTVADHSAEVDRRLVRQTGNNAS